MYNILIENSNVSYSSFALGTYKEVCFADDKMSNSIIQELHFKDVEFQNTNLIASQLIRTSLENIDLSTCDITGVAVTEECLKGLVVSELQALELSKLLGIMIK